MDGTPDAFDSPYRLLSGAVIPRPITWVSARGDDAGNLAPYSLSTAASVDPPVLIFAPVGRGSSLEGTPQSAISRGELVVNVVARDLMEAMNETITAVPPGVSEFDHAGIEKAEAVRVNTPRVANANVAFGCTLYDSMEVGSSTLVLGRVVHAYVANEMLTDDKLDTRKLDAIGRLADNEYAATDDRFESIRPG